MSINRRVGKEGVVYLYNEMLVIKRKEIGSLVEIWTDLEKVTQSEVSQKEKTTIVYALNMQANLENSSGHRAGKGQFSFQSLRKAMPKNAQTTHNCTHLT